MPNIDEYELLRNLAYQFWLDRGQPHGSPEIDWSRAQQQLQQQAASINTVISGDIQAEGDAHHHAAQRGDVQQPQQPDGMQSTAAQPVTTQLDTAAVTSIPTINDAVVAPSSRRNARRVKASALNANEVPMEVPPSPTTPPDQPPTKALTKTKSGRATSKSVTAKSRVALNSSGDDSRL